MKLTLREIFLLVTIVAVACGWWVERREFRRRAAQAEWADSRPIIDWLEDYLKAEGYRVKWLDDGSVWVTTPDGGETKGIVPATTGRQD
jgi:hypothetical protein